MRSLRRRFTMATTDAPRPRARSTVRLVSVVVPLWLMATISVSERSWRHLEARVLGGRRGLHGDRAVGQQAAEHVGHAHAGDGGRALTDHDDAPDGAVGQLRRPAPAGGAPRRRGRCSTPVVLADAAAQRLGKLVGASVISFSRKCGALPRSMSRVVISACTRSSSADRQLGAVVGDAADAVQRAGAGAVEHEHLTPAGVLARAAPASRRPCGGTCCVSSTRPYGSLATMKASSARPTYSAWPLPRRASSTWSGRSLDAAPMATEPSNEATVRRNASVASWPAATWRDTRAGITLASVVIGAGMRRP